MPDSRIAQARALLDDARCLVQELQDEGGTPVTTRRLGETQQHLRNALASLDWFDKPFKAEKFFG